jgi:hypothetical protein
MNTFYLKLKKFLSKSDRQVTYNDLSATEKDNHHYACKVITTCDTSEQLDIAHPWALNVLSRGKVFDEMVFRSVMTALHRIYSNTPRSHLTLVDA